MKNDSKPYILIVEDEPELATLMRDYLLKESYKVDILDSGAHAVNYVKENAIDLILLDLMLPDVDGLTICRQLRAFSQIPIIMTTARVDEIDRIIGLEIGADDYVCKPYSPREVVARVKVQLRRLDHSIDSEPLLRINADDLTLKHGQHSIELTSVEFNLLSLLMSSPGRIFSRDQLMDAAYSDQRIVSDRTIDSHIKKIRHKIKNMQLDLDLIHSIYGRGYKFDPRT